MLLNSGGSPRRRPTAARVPSPYTMRGGVVIGRSSPPASGWMATNIRTTPGRNNNRGSSNSYGGSSGGSSSYRPSPPPSPPPPPQPRRLSYQQLLSMVNGDPGLAAELASYGRFRNLARSQATANKGLLDTEYTGELDALTRSTEETRRLAEEEAAAAGRIRSNPYARRLGNINSQFEENRGRLSRSRTAGRTAIDQSLQTALEQYGLNENTARQNAINRLLASRSDITRGY